MKSYPVVWFEIYVENMGRAKAFYEAMFEVKLEKMSNPTEETCEEMNMEMWSFPKVKGCDMNMPGANGMLVKMQGYSPVNGGTLIYFGCEDCAVVASRAKENGGQIFRDKMAIGEYGYIALVNDTEGNMIGLHSMQ